MPTRSRRATAPRPGRSTKATRSPPVCGRSTSSARATRTRSSSRGTRPATRSLRPSCCCRTSRGTRALVATSRARARSCVPLDHPVLPRCFGVNLESDRPHIVLEYVDGPRLSTVIRRQRLLGVEQVVPLLQQVTAALHYLHGKGLVHLDVKPKNVIMSPPPRLIDLSVARSVASARRTTRPVGTDPYMAPEQCGVGLEHLMGPATDVWGLGVTLYESLTGIRPFPRGDRDANGRRSLPAAAARSGTDPSRRARTARDADRVDARTASRRPSDGGGGRRRARSRDRRGTAQAAAREVPRVDVEARANVRDVSAVPHGPLTTTGHHRR